MTRFDAIRLQLANIESDYQEALALREMQVRVLAAYRDELEDRIDIAVGMLVATFHYSKDEADAAIETAYEVLQAARKVAVGT